MFTESTDVKILTIIPPLNIHKKPEITYNS